MNIQEVGDLDVTSVSKRPEPLKQAEASIFVITAGDIRRSGADNLPEVLRLAPYPEVARQRVQLRGHRARVQFS